MHPGGFRKHLLLSLFALFAVTFCYGGCSLFPAPRNITPQQQSEVISGRCPGNSVWTGQACTTTTPSSPSRVAQTAPSTARADAFTDRFQANARDQLQKPYQQAPYPCSPFWSSSGKDGYVVDMTPWAAAAGLRRGDRPVAYGGTPLTGIEDADGEVWARVPHGDYVDVRVDRAGKEVSLRMPCRADRQR